MSIKRVEQQESERNNITDRLVKQSRPRRMTKIDKRAFAFYHVGDDEGPIHHVMSTVIKVSMPFKSLVHNAKTCLSHFMIGADFHILI